MSPAIKVRRRLELMLHLWIKPDILYVTWYNAHHTIDRDKEKTTEHDDARGGKKKKNSRTED